MLASGFGLAGHGASAQRGLAGQYKVGDALISVASDGEMPVPTDRINGKAPPGRQGIIERLKVENGATFAINVCVVEIGGKRTLIDAGAGGNWVPAAGKVVENLGHVGITPESIDLVVLTHAHADNL